MTLTQVQLVTKQHELSKKLKEKHNSADPLHPYILGVGFGLKETNGEVDDPPQVAYRVYFNSTCTNIGGEITVPFGVSLELPYPPICTINVAAMHLVPANVKVVQGSQHDVLVSGVEIHSGRGSADHGLGPGTLGFFATLDSLTGQEKFKNVLAVTCKHVLIEKPFVPNGPDKKVYGPGDEAWHFLKSIAEILDKSYRSSRLFRYDDDPGTSSDTYPYFMDVAAARLNVEKETTCCKSLCAGEKTRFDNAVQHLSGGITNHSRVKHIDLIEWEEGNPKPKPKLYNVLKSGNKTGLTEGRVIDVMAPYLYDNVIVIESTSKDANNKLLNFADEGDSGAALLNAQHEIVGMVFSIDATTQTRAYASHIHPVLAWLKATPVSNANLVPGSDTLEDTPFAIDDPGAGHAARLRAAFLGSTDGRLIADILLTHRSEILHLVNTNRRVTVAWHRHKGPGFVNHLVKNVRDPNHPIPQEIDGVTREALIRTMARVLAEHGSAALAEVATNYLDTALEYARRFDSLHELADGLKKEERA
ncbi:hypothetical protein SAMN02745121_08068 [Nannocystis exedens]|uniref:Uncharacterized protein n=1 Tax=Nannocystis exedens TaxID=54 RepID=A0A1I2HNE2_9BACT|nr:S1 family peptidase [Nannocystis exedens]PCC69347.1 hypothetical protein NAEX_02369 [Nannocystis exedens]SFF31038.1 hypothetical protein SAMN02745121_08068 [Nannocystis exedens]